MSKRKNHVPAFKARVALAALSGDKTIAELSSEFDVFIYNPLIGEIRMHAVTKEEKELYR